MVVDPAIDEEDDIGSGDEAEAGDMTPEEDYEANQDSRDRLNDLMDGDDMDGDSGTDTDKGSMSLEESVPVPVHEASM